MACAPACSSFSTIAASLLLLSSLAFLVLPALLLSLFLILTCVASLGFLCFLRSALHLWNPGIQAVRRERAARDVKSQLKTASVGQTVQVSDDELLLHEALRQLRVHQYLEDQLNYAGVLEEDPYNVIPCGSEESRDDDADDNSSGNQILLQRCKTI